MVHIAPSILAADFSRLGEQVRETEQAGAQRVHIDVMDGHFVPNLSMGPVVVKGLRPVTRLPLEVHLMVEEPARFVDSFIKEGADCLIVHQEVLPDARLLVDAWLDRCQRGRSRDLEALACGVHPVRDATRPARLRQGDIASAPVEVANGGTAPERQQRCRAAVPNLPPSYRSQLQSHSMRGAAVTSPRVEVPAAPLGAVEGTSGHLSSHIDDGGTGTRVSQRSGSIGVCFMG